MPKNRLAILQYNINKSGPTTHSMLNHPDSEQLAILMIQEQHRVARTKAPLIHQSWTLIEPPTQEDTRPRAAIYINNNILSPESYQPLHYPSTDIVILEVKIENKHPMLLINVYNTKGTPLINDLSTFLQAHLQRHRYSIIMVAGDFNLHHPLWNPPNYEAHDQEAEDLIECMAVNGLSPILPAGMITLPRYGTAIDLVWGNAHMERSVIKCKIARKHDHGSDHLPIITILNLTPEVNPQTPTYNYEKTDWKVMKTKLQEYLPKIDPNSRGNPSPTTVDQLAQELTSAIRKATQASTPRKRTYPFSKRWWNEELTEKRREVNRTRNRRWRGRTTEEEDEEWKEEVKEYRTMIKKAKRDTWRTFVKEADPTTIWKVKKYVDTTPTSPYIPTLNGGATSNKQKAEIFKSTFFPQPPPADLSDIKTATYPTPVQAPPRITRSQLKTAIEKLSPRKAPGPDEIPNLVLQKCYEEIEDYLLRLAQESFEACHFPTIFKESMTLVLRKPKKPDYTKPNAYRPIALESTIGKVLESIMAETISYLTETHELLPPNHFGGRPGRTTEDAMMLLTENIHAAWKEGRIFSAVFMDVAGAFNNVHHQRLIHNLKKRKIPPQITRWVESFLQDRSTRIKFNGTQSTTFPTPAGVPQGSPLSPILFIYYNADLLDIPHSDELALGFIDDIGYGVKGRTALESTTNLKHMLVKAEDWRKKHSAQFEKSKYILIHFTRSKSINTEATLTIDGITIAPAAEARYLGVTFDQTLKYRATDKSGGKERHSVWAGNRGNSTEQVGDQNLSTYEDYSQQSPHPGWTMQLQYGTGLKTRTPQQLSN